MKKFTLILAFLFIASFSHLGAQTCQVINNTPLDYIYLMNDFQSTALGATTPSISNRYLVPASSTISFNNTYFRLAGGTLGAGGHFGRSSLFTSRNVFINNLYSDLFFNAIGSGSMSQNSFVNPFTGGLCTFTESYDPITGEHEVVVEIN